MLFFKNVKLKCFFSGCGNCKSRSGNFFNLAWVKHANFIAQGFTLTSCKHAAHRCAQRLWLTFHNQSVHFRAFNPNKSVQLYILYSNTQINYADLIWQELEAQEGIGIGSKLSSGAMGEDFKNQNQTVNTKGWHGIGIVKKYEIGEVHNPYIHIDSMHVFFAHWHAPCSVWRPSQTKLQGHSTWTCWSLCLPFPLMSLSWTASHWHWPQTICRTSQSLQPSRARAQRVSQCQHHGPLCS